MTGTPLSSSATTPCSAKRSQPAVGTEVAPRATPSSRSSRPLRARWRPRPKRSGARRRALAVRTPSSACGWACTPARRAGGDNYVGLDVHRAARVAAAGHGGQVLLSGRPRLCGGNLPPGIGFTDLGQHRLKDLSRPEHLWQLRIEGLPTTSRRPHAGRHAEQPAPPADLVPRPPARWRRSEPARRAPASHPDRAGRHGQDRLALQVAAEAADLFPAGVYFVALEPIANPDLFIPTVAQAAGMPTRGRPPAANG